MPAGEAGAVEAGAQSGRARPRSVADDRFSSRDMTESAVNHAPL